MARPVTSTTPRTDDFRVVDLAKFRRHGGRRVGVSGTLTWRHRGEFQASIAYRLESRGLRLLYRTTLRSGAVRDVNELIRLVATELHFGGVRQWFLCPSCARRCRLLYGGTYFRCRLCVGAYYELQYETAPYRALRRRWRIRQQIEDRSGDEWAFGLDDGFPPRPPRMHGKTYRRLEALDAELDGRCTEYEKGMTVYARERRSPRPAGARRRANQGMLRQAPAYRSARLRIPGELEQIVSGE